MLHQGSPVQVTRPGAVVVFPWGDHAMVHCSIPSFAARPDARFPPQLERGQRRRCCPVCAPVGGSALCLHSISCSEMRLSLPSSWATGWPLSRVSCTGKTFSSCSVGCWVCEFSPGSPASICTGAGVRGRQLHSPTLHPRPSRYTPMHPRVWVPPKCSALASSTLRLPQPLPCPSQAA